MPENASPLAESIRREAKVVGLRDFRTPSLEAVEQRRMQLWILTTVLLVSVSAGIGMLSIWPNAPRSWLSPSSLRWGVIVLSLAFCAYAIEKEFHLRRLARLLTDERVLTTALSNRLHEVSLLLEAGKAMNSILELNAVLDVILRSAIDLLNGKSGSIMLLEGEELMAACVIGNAAAKGRTVRVGNAISGHVAKTREPLLIKGRADGEAFPDLMPRDDPVESSMCVPLLNRDDVLGVLSVNAESRRAFSEYDLRALSLFAEQAASAIANARLYESERTHVAELVELDRVKTELVDIVTHELRTPLTAVLAASEGVQRPELGENHAELIHIIDQNAHYLAAMIEDLVISTRLERGRKVGATGPVDVAEVARMVGTEFEISDRPVLVQAPVSAPILSNPDSLRRILENLVDNAHKYGKPPVRVIVEPLLGGVTVWVMDAGPGIAPENRERVFERFSRLGHHRGKPGLGLGLPIVRGLAESFGGSVTIEDSPTGGCAFRVQLPACPPAEDALRHEATPSATSGGTGA
jgi:two-component system, OmpR family, sensor histidine kinase KdpD